MWLRGHEVGSKEPWFVMQKKNLSVFYFPSGNQHWRKWAHPERINSWKVCALFISMYSEPAPQAFKNFKAQCGFIWDHQRERRKVLQWLNGALVMWRPVPHGWNWLFSDIEKGSGNADLEVDSCERNTSYELYRSLATMGLGRQLRGKNYRSLETMFRILICFTDRGTYLTEEASMPKVPTTYSDLALVYQTKGIMEKVTVSVFVSGWRPKEFDRDNGSHIW